MRRLLFCLIYLISTTCLLGCKGTVRYQDEDFRYSRKGRMNEELICLDGLTSKGKTKKILVIPDEYEGYRVIIRQNAMMNRSVNIQSEDLERIYIMSGIENPSNLITDTDVKIIIISNEASRFPNHGILFVTKEVYDKKQKKQYNLFPANLSYKYNYEDAPNGGYYWIDDYDNELITYIPKNPAREGYTFDGWYKEIECIQKWDFDKDLIPEKKYVHNQDYEYEETVLYAKWVKE